MIEFKERAWLRDGTWQGTGDPEPVPETSAKHQCYGKANCEGSFVCVWCQSHVGYCFGCAHDGDLESLLCDECWVEREDYELQQRKSHVHRREHPRT